MKVICDISVTSARNRSREGWHPGYLFRGGKQGLMVDTSQSSVLYDAASGGTEISNGSIAIGRVEDKSGNAHHLIQPQTNLRPMSMRAPVVGVRNRLVSSAPTVAEYSQRGGTMTDDTGFSGVPNSVQIPDNGATIYGYFNADLPPAAAGTFSLHVKMADNYPPVFGSGSSTNVGNTFVLRVNNGNADPTTYAIQQIGFGEYRVSVPVIGIGSGSYGFIRYSSNEQRSFNITGYQLEIGATSAYQNVTDGGLNVSESGVPHVLGLSFDGIDDVLSTTLVSGLVGEAFVAGRGACHSYGINIAPGGAFNCGPSGFTDALVDSLLAVAGHGTVSGPALFGIILREGTFATSEKNALSAYFTSRGAGSYQEII